MLRLFLPEICIHCSSHCDNSDAKTKPLGNYLCKVCLRQLELFEPLMQDDLLPKSSLFRELPFQTRIGSAFQFENGGIIQSVIHHFKYQEMPGLAKILGSICTQKNSAISKDYDFIIPVPLHRTRFSDRGYNQSEMLAYGISHGSKIPVAKRKWLKRIRQTPSQTGMTLEQREENVRGAFALSKTGKKELQGKRVLLIDDVMTTGATLASAASALVIAKPKQVDIFAMAAVIDI
jgi:ComF family protein